MYQVCDTAGKVKTGLTNAWTRASPSLEACSSAPFEPPSYLVRGLDVVEPRLLVSGNLVHVDAVDEPLHARKKNHNLVVQKNRGTVTEKKQAPTNSSLYKKPKYVVLKKKVRTLVCTYMYMNEPSMHSLRSRLIWYNGWV